MHLYSNIKYQMSGQEIESLFHPGQQQCMGCWNTQKTFFKRVGVWTNCGMKMQQTMQQFLEIIKIVSFWQGIAVSLKKQTQIALLVSVCLWNTFLGSVMSSLLPTQDRWLTFNDCFNAMTQRASCIFEIEPNAIESRRKSTSWTFSSLTSRVTMLLTRNLFRLWENWAKTNCSHRTWPLHLSCEHKIWLPTAIYVLAWQFSCLIRCVPRSPSNSATMAFCRFRYAPVADASV